MAKDLFDLAKNVRKLRDNVKFVANDVKKIVSEDVMENLVDVTPVDTSRALSNWQVGLGSPSISSNFAFFQGAAASSLLPSTNLIKLKNKHIISIAKPGTDIFISNSVEYINKLDRGTSDQFEGGFLMVASITASKSLQSLKIPAVAFTKNKRLRQPNRIAFRRSPN